MGRYGIHVNSESKGEELCIQLLKAVLVQPLNSAASFTYA